MKKVSLPLINLAFSSSFSEQFEREFLDGLRLAITQGNVDYAVQGYQYSLVVFNDCGNPLLASAFAKDITNPDSSNHSIALIRPNWNSSFHSIISGVCEIFKTQLIQNDFPIISPPFYFEPRYSVVHNLPVFSERVSSLFLYAYSSNKCTQFSAIVSQSYSELSETLSQILLYQFDYKISASYTSPIDNVSQISGCVFIVGSSEFTLSTINSTQADCYLAVYSSIQGLSSLDSTLQENTFVATFLDVNSNKTEFATALKRLRVESTENVLAGFVTGIFTLMHIQTSMNKTSSSGLLRSIYSSKYSQVDDSTFSGFNYSPSIDYHAGFCNVGSPVVKIRNLKASLLNEKDGIVYQQRDGNACIAIERTLYNEIRSAYYYTVTIISALGILSSAFGSIWIIKNRSSSTIKEASASLICHELLGVAMIFGSVIARNSSVTLCVISKWLEMLGFVLVFIPKSISALRIVKMYKSDLNELIDLSKIISNAWTSALITWAIALLCSIYFVLLGIWGDLKSQYILKNSLQYQLICIIGGSGWWVLVPYLCQLLILIVGLSIIRKTRSSWVYFKDSTISGLTMFSYILSLAAMIFNFNFLDVYVYTKATSVILLFNAYLILITLMHMKYKRRNDPSHREEMNKQHVDQAIKSQAGSPDVLSLKSAEPSGSDELSAAPSMKRKHPRPSARNLNHLAADSLPRNTRPSQTRASVAISNTSARNILPSNPVKLMRSIENQIRNFPNENVNLVLPHSRCFAR